MNKQKTQSGFAHLMIIGVVAGLGLLGALGFVFYNNFVSKSGSGNASDSSSTVNKVDFKTFEEAYLYLKDKTGYKQPMLTGFRALFNDKSGEKQWSFQILDKSSENTPKGEKFARYNMKNYKIRNNGYFYQSDSIRIISDANSRDYGITLGYKFDEILKAAKDKIEERGLKPGYIYMVELTDYSAVLNDYWDVTYANSGEEAKVSGEGRFELDSASVELNVKDLSFKEFQESTFTLSLYGR